MHDSEYTPTRLTAGRQFLPTAKAGCSPCRIFGEELLKPMPLRVVRLGTAREPDEGLRIGTVRRPPRGVRKEDYAGRDYFDVWLPAAWRLIALLAALSRQTNFSVGCYCADEARCHRSLLKELLIEQGAEMV